ncbi:MAG: helix-turn-helix domain-containing protein [Planctomycetes bacterium]|nr:helix-turn-helix domain-containing protein [Planctomycetota bacterium]
MEARTKGVRLADALAVDAGEAARLLSTCRKTVLREIERGHIRAFRIGRQWRIRVIELEAYMQRAEQGQ